MLQILRSLKLAMLVAAFSLSPWLAQASDNSATGNLQIAILGDSLTAGFGLEPGEAFPEQLQTRLSEMGRPVTVINAGVSGDTSSGGLSRLEWSIPETVKLVVVELGANDALRGIRPELTECNLDQIIAKLKARNQDVILAGMLAPPNMGPDYGDAFNPIYARLAQKNDVTLYPFFLDGVAAVPALNLRDGMHPNAEGIALIVDRMLPLIEEKLEKLLGVQ